MNAYAESTGHGSNAFDLSVEMRMTQETPEIECGFARLYIQPYQAVKPVTQPVLEEILILREEGHAPQSMEQWYDVLIWSSKSGDVLSDLTVRHAPLAEQLLLGGREVFVEQVQAA